ncbi:MAG: hypothetical protein Q8N79_10700 [Candidatus Methanoperedens sp.]|nr:hypothetical protein [Candidatus Methanoperedens sp.]
MSVVRIKEFKAKNEEELLDFVMLWPKFDEEWHKGGEWIEPEDRVRSIAKPKTLTKRKRGYRER